MFSWSRKAFIQFYNTLKIVFSRFIVTIYYMEIQGVTRGDWGLKGVTGGYNGLQEITRGYSRLQRITEKLFPY